MKAAVVLTLLATSVAVSAGKKCAPMYQAPIATAAVTSDPAPIPQAEVVIDGVNAAAVDSSTFQTDSIAVDNNAQVAVDAGTIPDSQAETADAVVQVAQTADADGPAPAPQAELPNTTDVVPVTTDAAPQVVVITTDALPVVTTNVPQSPQPTAQAVAASALCNGSDYSGCSTIAKSDFQDDAAAQAAVSGLSFDDACLVLNNRVRSKYPNNGQFVYDAGLAAWATVSAAYAGKLGVFNAHSYSGNSYTWGQNLFVGPSTCADAYYGWITEEALTWSDGAGHFLNAAAITLPYVSVGCGAANGAIVCNYGLTYPADLSMLPDINTALANANLGFTI
ncbi:hypothetical protein BCR33DRAFT_784453 [Rhizoclosmatium globosum]|uniref:SCP domain-containing protein n=1 Tax=Rhizoclosmatium globosum TaxID=329046 RepID=A0A1Y2CHB9_9FUNG|nr:hypothetical protein BCR33DRAFT_784453 [Rhizoclosmatium globosum]|eukprot:ORY45715.1 hypothetical protein BCR33DRAFT_784453 [Rhizoclosmatium globosum]